MPIVTVRSLTGTKVEVDCPQVFNIRQLKGKLGESDPNFSSCKLFLRVGDIYTNKFLSNSLLYLSLRDRHRDMNLLAVDGPGFVSLQGKALSDSVTIEALSLQPNEFLVRKA